MFTLSIFNLFIWKYKQQTIVFRFWHHFERNWSLKWAMCFCFVKELNCFTNHYFSLPFSSEVFTESKVEVKMRFFHLLLCCWVSASMAAVPVILDTDMDFDVDDVGALCVLHALQVRLLSWGNCLGLCLSHLRDWQGSLWGKADWSQTDSCSRILGRLSW